MEDKMKNNILWFFVYLALAFSFTRLYDLQDAGYHQAVLVGDTEQYLTRVLFPFTINYISAFMNEFSIPYISDISRLYKIAFILFLALSALVFQFYLQLWFAKEVSILGTLFLLLSVNYGFVYGGHVDSIFNLFLFIVSAQLMVKKKFWPLFIIVPFGALNRETILFIPLLYFIGEYVNKNKHRIILNTAVLLFLGLSVHTFIRFLRGGFASFGYSDIFLWNFACHHCNIALFFLFSFFGVIAFVGLNEKPPVLRRWALTVPFFLLANYHLGSIREVRMFWALAVIIIPLALWTLFPEDSRLKH